LPRIEQTAEWPQMAMAYVNQASFMLGTNEAIEAGRYLALAATLNRNFGGRLEYATKSPDTFFERLSKLQAGIASQTGSDPLSGMVDYLFQKRGDQYIVAREEMDPEVNGVTIDGVNQSESLVQAHYLKAQDGRVILEETRWFIGPKGSVSSTLNNATREVVRDQYGRYEPNSVQHPVFTAPEGGNEPHSSPSPAMASPAGVKDSTPQPKASPTPAAVETESSSSFPILPVAIVGAVILGIVIYVLRRKST
jgi:hypothetical protein